MIRRILNSRLPLMVYNPVKVFDVKYFKEISSAGALPVFDTEFLTHDDILQNAALLSREKFSFGIRLSTHDHELINKIRNQQMINLDLLITPLTKDDTPSDFTNFAETKIAIEIKDININDKIKEICPHALILKGNEAGGKVSRYSSFILMQWYLKNSELPIFIHGGVGKYTAAGMFAAGVSGLVMDSQLLMTDEAPVSENFKKLLAMVDESDSTEITYDGSDIYRVFAKLGTKIVKELKIAAVEVGVDPQGKYKVYESIKTHYTSFDKQDVQFIQSLFYLGQDGVFAKDFVKDATGLTQVISNFFKTIGENLNFIDAFDPVKPGSPFAKDQGTKFPLIQGPMANISDNAQFANKVLEQGALPFFAVGSLPEQLADNMLKDGTRKVDNFGAGLVGIEAFNPMVKKHLDMVKKYKVPYALFAGGNPSQVAELEKAGTKTYLHTPSVSMMENALKSGCKRFIFEGGEAGGHVGSLSSMVLWEVAITSLMNKNYDLSDVYLVFAGGISTRFASFFISGLTSFLASKGAKIGIQVGTAYLFADEIVETKSIKSQYRDIIIHENQTMVIGKSLGLASRTAPTSFAWSMLEAEARMIKNKESLEKRKRAFEKKNIGSLLIGAKGFLPDFKNPGPDNYTWFEDDEHKEKGNFLVGDSLAFFDRAVTIEQIHNNYFKAKSELCKNINFLEIFSSVKNKINDEIAVVGIGCTLPDADDPDSLWDNILNKKYSISEMPESRFDRDLYYDPDKSAEDKTYTILAGHVEHFEFDKVRFGYAEGKEKRLSRSQKMVLQTAYKAVENAGLLGDDDRFVCEDPAKTAVIIATCLSNELSNDIQLKYWYPELVSMMEKTDEYQTLNDDEKQIVKQGLMEGMEANSPGYDPVHGILLNIEASRIARHLGVRGTNYVVDAACASSVTALDAAMGELLSGDHDQVIVGGVNTHLAPESFIGFAKMGALSKNGSYPFDERADGFILGEGSVVFVLKRMKDAIRDKNNILGIINSIGSSSDGRGKAIAAPNPTGQVLSVQRCFENIRPDIKPEDIGFIEAHGTSTTVGDQAELETLNSIYKNSGAGVSSIKSQIGHLLGCAGSAGLLKALLTVNKGKLPPNGQFETLSKNHDLKESSLFIVKDTQEFKFEKNKSRKAAVSSYGFGGINYHMVVEQMTDNYQTIPRDIFVDPTYDFNDDRIVVAGLGVFLPGAKNTEEFWEKLESGEKQLSHIPAKHFDNDAYANLDKTSHYRLPKVNAGVVREVKFNNLKYRMPPMMVKSIERGQIFGLEAANEALESSGLLDCISASNKVGVILGTIAGERQSKNIVRVRKQFIGNIIKNCQGIDGKKLNKVSDALVASIRNTIPENNEDTTPGLLSNIISGRIANYFGLNGANYVIDASCASAFVAMRNAARNLKHKDLDFVLAGGVDCNLYPAVLMAFKRLGLLSEGDCNFYDSRADGYVMGEGAAIHMMTTYKKAREYNMEILGEINESAVRSSVPDHLLAPSEHTFVSTINETYYNSGIRKQDINHLDIFAFSNIFGDIVEKQVIENCFDHEMHCGNIKSQFGYFKAANPAVAMAKMMLMSCKGKILPDFNYNPEHSILNDGKILKPSQQIVVKPKGQPFRFAANVNGIGGNHCHMIMSTLPALLEPRKEISAVKAAVEDDIVIKDHAYSADDRGKKLRMVALLSGQGAQRSRMMKELFEKDAHIKKVMEKGEEIFVEQRGYSLLDMMFGTDDAINSTQNTQPAVFLSSAAVYSRLSREGFSPDYFIGHSVGEYTALFCSGMLSFADAMRLIIKRSDLMHEATLKVPGKIMVVFKNEKETEHLIRKSNISNIYITNKNSEKQTAVSGKAEDIEKFCTFLTQQDIFYKRLNLTGAFHTPLLKEASDKLRQYLDTLTFNDTRFGRIISNTIGKPYPEGRADVKDLLARQIISPVEFIKSIENVYESGRTHFIEIGPSRLLVNLLKNINIGEYGTSVSVDAKLGEIKSFEACRKYLKDCNSIFETKPAEAFETKFTPKPFEELPKIKMSENFESFKLNNQKLVDQILYKEYQHQKRQTAIDAIERYDFNTQKILISGVSVGLPGKDRRVFAADNFDAILNGENFIESLTPEDQDKIIDKNITKLFKQPDGNARFVQITKAEDVIHLAGQLGYFDLMDEYGIKEQYDITMAIGIAAGIEALKDANIPLVMQYKKMKGGKVMIPDGFALPEEMQEDTGVIISCLWPSQETLIEELEKYYYQKFFLKPYEEFENIYYYLMEKVTDTGIKEQITEWFFKAKSGKKKDFKEYKFDRYFAGKITPLGSAYFAQIIKAKGPNTLVSAACASTALAIGIAEDWIRVGRCKRVIVIGGENATSQRQNQWIGSGFLSLGAASIKKRVSQGAKPFDEDRNGTILGAGAVGLVVEAESCVRERGMEGQCEILGTHMANSAFHTFSIDVKHLASEMNKFVNKVEKRNGLKKEDYANKLLFMSHETYTPARGGSADAEVTALQTAFADHLDSICISNTKGFTGHTLGAAIEDVVMVKALQKRKAPPIANLKKIPEHFKNLNFSGQEKINSEYGLHLAAGFGSHLAFLFVKRVEENPVEGNVKYENWIKQITGSQNPELKIIDNTLCAVSGGEALPKAAKEIRKVVTPDKTAVPSMPAAPVPVAAIKEIEKEVEPKTVKETIKGESAEAPVVAVAEAKADDITAMVKEVIAVQTGYTADMLEDDLDLEADLGVDTVKQVEIFAKLASSFGFSVPDDLKLRDLNTIAKLGEYIQSKTGKIVESKDSADAPQTADSIAAGPGQGDDVTAMVKEVIAVQTGYTADMLEDDLDLEADLGVDTVKQVEIFAKLASNFGFSVPDDLKLRDLNTIAKLGEYIQSRAVGLVESKDSVDAPEQAGTIEVGPGQGDDVSAMVKEVIAVQTGYTADMLEGDLDLEADLGVDTVKQVEIFAKLASKFGFSVPDDLKLRDLNTITKLSDYIKSQAKVLQTQQAKQAAPFESEGANKDASPVTPLNEDDEFPDPLSPIKRLIVRAEELDIPGISKKDFKGKKIIVSLDSHGFAKEIIKKIKQKKGEVITIGSKGADFKFDLTDIKATEKRVAKFKEKYPEVNGFIHLLPLDYYFDQKDDSDDTLNTTIKSFFVMIKALFESLDHKENVIGTITFDSVVFPYMENCGDIHPMFAGLSGLMKTANKELADTRVKVVDFSYKHPIKNRPKIVDAFLFELLCDDARCEVGYKDKKRYGISMKPSIADKTQKVISGNDTLLVTGGAGGITYEIIKKVVEKYKTNLIILDINDIYSTDPKYLDKASSDPELMAKLRDDMPGEKPIEIKRALDRLLRVRQSVENIETLKSMGVSVEYNCVDVTNAKAVKKACDKYDRIDGIFHAAGMEMSQFIAKKELWSFELVVDVKVKGLQNLIEAFKDRDYKYFFTFSSVTARFGNEGQVDYTAANDFLGKMLFRQKQLYPERTYKVYAWTAWGGVGMATNPTVKAVLEQRGIQFLPMEQGVKFFMADLLDKTESEMVFSGLDYSFDKDGLLGDPGKVEFPFLDTPVAKTNSGVTYSRVLDIKRDVFLHDHTMEDVPLFLGSTGIETMAEVAKSLSEEKANFVELTDFQIPYGIKLLKGRSKELLVSGSVDGENSFDCRITSQFKNPKGIAMGDPKLHYEGKYRFAQKPLKAKKIKLPTFTPVSWEGDLEPLVYDPKRLFMFGLFSTITDINSFDGKTLITTMEDKSEKEFFKGIKDPKFVAAPILVDAMFQTGGLLEFFTTSRTVLPYKIKSLKFYANLEKNKKYFCITQKKASGEETNTYDLKLIDKKGNVFVEVDSFEMVKLNQLDPEDRIIDRVEFSF
ncbi:MAG: acyltransferase domain-containing protein [Desulfobacula sp.]|uniref:beta-ketoacyl synthase N-terminal-like domain-containing protein n=1 Tax=Desulfobacula sp. TaxID=2593537 RepID=UPI001ED0DEAD|nr:acyltransferase domain-containing protein [Desulfobacula sp.]